MAVLFRASASASTGGTAATSLAINKPAGVAQNDVLIASLAFGAAATFTITPPSGWTLIERIDSGFYTLATYVKTAGGSEGSSYSWSTSGAAKNIAGLIRAYYNDASPLRAWLANSASAITVSGTSHATPAILSTSADIFVVETFMLTAAGTWTPPGSATEREDVATSSGSNDVAISGADETQAAKWTTTGTKTATSSASAVGITNILGVVQNGVAQPAGAGGTITFEDNSVSPAGSGFGAAQFAAFADFLDLGTFGRKAYRGKVTVQNGDGVGTATTTWKDTRVDVYFDNTKTYLVNSTGLANRYTEFGLLATSASGEPVGYDGCHLYCGANPFGVNNAANFKLYDSSIENYNTTAATGRVFLSPNIVGAVTDMVDVKVFTLAGFQAFGAGGVESGIIGRMMRVTSIGFASGLINGHVTQFNCPNSDRFLIYWPNGDRKFNTGSYQRLANPTFIGPSTVTDARNQQAFIVMNPAWSQNCLKPDKDTVNFFEEWWEFGVLVTDKAGNPLSGVRVEMWDFFDKRFVVDTYTNAQGTIDFIAPQSVGESPPFYLSGPLNTYPDAPFRNALMVGGHNNDGVTHDHYPFRMHVNRGKALPGYEEQTQLVGWPYFLFLTTEKQFKPLFLHLILKSEDDQGVDMEAAGVERIIAEVPAYD